MAPCVLELQRRPFLLRIRSHLHGYARSGDLPLPDLGLPHPLRSSDRLALHVRRMDLSPHNRLLELSRSSAFLHDACSSLRLLRSFDLANGQKSWFKAHQTGTFIKRNTFPQIPGTELVDPKVIVTETGSKLLCDGVWGVVRKPSELPLFWDSTTILLTSLAYRLHLGLDSSSHLGPFDRLRLLHPLLVSRFPPYYAPPPQRS
jgi:hypothetical protein